MKERDVEKWRIQVKGKHNEKQRSQLSVSPPSTPPLPIPPGGGAAKTPYPNYEITRPDKWALDWDEKTRRLVAGRIFNVPIYRYFSPLEASLLEALCDRLLPQEDRPSEDKIPIAPWIDDRLSRGDGRGYQYEGMPDDGAAYHLGLQGFDQCAQALYEKPFVELKPDQQDETIRSVQAGSPPGEAWKKVSADRFFGLLMGDIITNYYAHPSAQAEIGFSGPASPRGHIRLDLGFRDPWEAKEERPLSSVELVRKASPPRKAAAGGETH